jgi:hypothetical protein
MSSSLHHAMIRDQQCEIAAGTVHAHHTVEAVDRSRRPRVGPRVRRVVAAASLGLGLASTGVALAYTTKPPVQASGTHIDRGTKVWIYERRIHALEAQGYVGEACTVKGILMFNPHTKRSVIVAL